MSTVDIRDTSISPVDKVVFADAAFESSATFLQLSHGTISLQVDESEEYESVVINKNSVESLIKALQKAIDLGWTENK